MSQLLLPLGILIGTLIYRSTAKEERNGLVALTVGTICGGIFTASLLPPIGVPFLDLGTSITVWFFCGLALRLAMQHMNKGVEFNLATIFGFGFFSPVLAAFTVLALLFGWSLFGKANV